MIHPFPPRTMPVHTGRLLLATQDPFLLPQQALLTAALSEAGLLGSPLEGREGMFAVGERFLQLIAFAGCSVQIDRSPADDAPFCHIRFTGPFQRPMFSSGRNTRPPRCRNCRGRLQHWRQMVSGWDRDGPAQITCPACGEASLLWDYDWKEKAGFGRLFIQVEEVFPGEAVPTSELMALLEGSSGCRWLYFYIQDG